MPMNNHDYRFVDYLWNEADIQSADAVARLVYRSNLLGADTRITNTVDGRLHEAFLR